MLLKKIFSRSSLLVVVVAGVTGCKTLDRQVESTHDDCLGFGFQPGTDSFKRCVARRLNPENSLETERQAIEREREKLAYKKEKLRHKKAVFERQKKTSSHSAPSTVVVVPSSMEPSVQSSPPSRNEWQKPHDQWARQKQKQVQVLDMSDVEKEVERRRIEQEMLQD